MAWIFICIHVFYILFSCHYFAHMLSFNDKFVLLERTLTTHYTHPSDQPLANHAATHNDVIAPPTTEPSHTPHIPLCKLAHIPFGESSHPPLLTSQTRTPLIQRAYPWRSMAPTWAGDIARYLLREITSTPSWWCHRAPWWRQSIGGKKRWMN